jgi:hypothetical protein
MAECLFITHLNIETMIQRNRRPLAIRSLVLVALCAILFSFTEKLGGDSYTIYLNDRLLLKEYVHDIKNVKSISLSESSANDVLKINYSHCGKIGVARNISIKDAQNKILKTWTFQDVEGNALPTMSFKVKEIVALQKNKGTKLNLVYSSKELPGGRLLAAIEIPDDTKASLK